MIVLSQLYKCNTYTPYRATVLLLLLSLVLSAQPAAPTNLSAQAYDHHAELSWDFSPDPSIQGYRIYGRTGMDTYSFLGFVNNVETSFIHFIGDWDITYDYQITAVNQSAQESEVSNTISATTFEMTDEELLDMVQAYTFRYFWDFAHPVSGLARERNTTSTVTSGGSGFGVMAIIVGAERGFVTYEEALTRTDKIVDFLLTAARFKGAFPHWMNGATGQVIPFSTQDNGGDLVETAFLIQGLLTAREYFAGESETEIALRAKITQIWEEVNWNWYRKLVGNVLYWHWSPNFEFAINLPIRGFNETHIVYLLAIAAPVEAHNIPVSLYHDGWAGGNYTNGSNYYGFPLEVGGFRGGPLFFSHYSYLGFDPRGIADQYTNYFVRNTYHSLINQAHCIVNPYNREGYSASNWGLTASDDPDGYKAHAPTNPSTDNGTITPTAALGSMPYTPQQSMAALKHFYRVLGDKTWGKYGFKDAFNEGRSWYANSYLAIDQGPIICMIENHRSGLLWDLFMANPEIDAALDAIGFQPDTTTVNASRDLPAFLAEAPVLGPNPAIETSLLSFKLHHSRNLSLDLLDANGRLNRQFYQGLYLSAGEHQLALDVQGLAPGTYFVRLRAGAQHYILPLIILSP